MYCSSFPTPHKRARYIALTGYYYHLVKEDTWLHTHKNQHLSAVPTPAQLLGGGLNQVNQYQPDRAPLASMNGVVSGSMPLPDEGASTANFNVINQNSFGTRMTSLNNPGAKNVISKTDWRKKESSSVTPNLIDTAGVHNNSQTTTAQGTTPKQCCCPCPLPSSDAYTSRVCGGPIENFIVPLLHRNNRRHPDLDHMYRTRQKWRPAR